MSKRMYGLLPALLALILATQLVACGESEIEVAQEPTGSPATSTAEPTATTAPTETSQPTPTDAPTATPIPTATNEPTETPVPEPTLTEAPTRPPNPTATPDERESEDEQGSDGSDDDAGGAVDGQALVTKANEEMSRLPSYRSQFSYNVTTVVSDPSETITLTQSLEGDCVQEGPTRAYCNTLLSIDFAGFPISQTLETVQDGEQFWVRENGQEWVESPEGQVEQLTPNTDYGDIVESAEVVSETEINGVPVYQVRLTIDPALYLEETLGEDPDDLAFSDVQFEVVEWIGRDDFLIYKSRINFSASGDQDGQTVQLLLQLDLSNSDFGEPVEIPDPTVD